MKFGGTVPYDPGTSPFKFHLKIPSPVRDINDAAFIAPDLWVTFLPSSG